MNKKMAALTSFNEGFNQQISFLVHIPVSRHRSCRWRKNSVQKRLNNKTAFKIFTDQSRLASKMKSPSLPLVMIIISSKNGKLLQVPEKPGASSTNGCVSK